MAIASLTLPDPAFSRDALVLIDSGSAQLRAPVRSARALRDAGVVKQGYDYSCGSAALATLLTYGIGDPVDEQWVLETVFSTVTEEQRSVIVDKGLSLLDLQRVSEQRGHAAQGFRVRADQLAGITRPVIVFIKPRGYEHFAVLKGIKGDRAYLADPSLGNLRMPLYRFLDMWADENAEGIIFALEPAGGDWPATSVLGLSPDDGPPLEQLSARELLEVGKPYQTTFPTGIGIR